MKGLNKVLWKVSVAGLAIVGSLTAVTTAANAGEASTPRQQASPAGQTTETVSTQSATIVGLASSSEGFETLTAALEAAGLVDVLNGTEVYTVFAPTDEAFAALPAGTVETLLQPENRDQLIQILTYHVVPGRALSTNLSAGSVSSVEGSPLDIAISDAGVLVNGANVIQADVEASNGVIHVIDQVLLPPAQ